MTPLSEPVSYIYMIQIFGTACNLSQIILILSKLQHQLSRKQ